MIQESFISQFFKLDTSEDMIKRTNKKKHKKIIIINSQRNQRMITVPKIKSGHN